MSMKYLINFNKIMGRGTTAKVCLGVDLENGQEYAFKCSNYDLDKEISTMKVLDHKNIVKYYDSLIDFSNFKNVIVMEFCNKGSLYEFTMLHQGLCDNMFLKVLECMKDGMFYLRSKEIIHRDIKPGNIMIHQNNMGYFHVKFGDLGTAKQVADDQCFMSMVGTVQYLHPHMYTTYLAKKGGKFKSYVDLWAIGVTLYQAVVNYFPFIPFILSDTKMLEHMHKIKEPGIISGRQNSKEVDDITWSNQLPDECRLSTMLKDLASKLIGDLLDLSESNTYERFYEDANNILQKKRLLVFNSLSGELQILYLSNASYNDAVNQILNIMKCPKEELIILSKNNQFLLSPDENIHRYQSIPVRGHINYTLTDDTALIVPSKLNSETLPLLHPQPSTTTFNEPRKTFSDFKNVYAYSNKLMKAIYDVRYCSNYVDCQLDCYFAVFHYFNELILKQKVLLIKQSAPPLIESIRELCTTTEYLMDVIEAALNNMEFMSTNSKIISCRATINKMRSDASIGVETVENLTSRFIIKEELMEYTEKKFFKKEEVVTNENIDFLVYLAEELVNEVKLMPQKQVSDNDEYILEIWQRHKRLLKHFHEAQEKFVAKSQHIFDMHKSFNNWLKIAHDYLSRINDLQNFFIEQGKRKEILMKNIVYLKDYLLEIVEDNHIKPNIQIQDLDLDKNGSLENCIMEIKELTEKVKKKYYGQKA